jgi:hypothetical protein
MWASTLLRARELAAVAFSAALSLAPIPASAADGSAVQPLPESVRALAPGLAVQGEGNVRWFGLPIYHSWLWSPAGGWRENERYALEIRYARHITGEQLAERSIDEMRHIKVGTDQQHQQWRQAMQKTFPDVQDGDRLIGLATPGAATRFFMNGKPIGDIDDPAFGPAFFGIWLSPATSRPDLRRMLLGQNK